jgi:hypothetical protein
MTMTTIRNRGRGGLLRLVNRWLGRDRPACEKPEFLTLEGLNGHLMRDIGLSLHSDRFPHRDVRRNDERTNPRAAAISTDNHGANAVLWLHSPCGSGHRR